jgi:hypothetical protein
MTNALRVLRNRLRARVLQPVDNRLWGFWTVSPAPYCIHSRVHVEEIPRYASDVNVEELRRTEPRIYDDLMHRFSEYAYEFRVPLIIEPRRGWLIPRPFRVIQESFPLVNDPWDGTKPRPSTWDYFVRRRIAVTLEHAISLPFAWHNYYHFFLDALPQLLVLEALGVSRDIPVVVPEQFATTRFVTEFRQLSTLLDGRTFIVQKPGEYVRVLTTTYVAKDTSFSPALFRILDSLNHVSMAAAGPERIYLRRNPSGPRALANDLEITTIAERYGYVAVDTAKLSLREQIALFRGARLVVGIHGAGLTNIMFRRGNNLRLLEISPADLGSTHYRSLCTQLGHEYSRLSGGQLGPDRRFHLDPAQFERALRVLESGRS